MMPLAEFPDDRRAKIEHLASLDTPPPKMLTLCDRDGRPMAQIRSRAYYEWRLRHPDSGRISPEIRVAVIDRDGYVCGLCGGAVEPDDVHIDHIHPRSLGGPNTLENLQVSHSLCNIRKGNRV